MKPLYLIIMMFIITSCTKNDRELNIGSDTLQFNTGLTFHANSDLSLVMYKLKKGHSELGEFGHSLINPLIVKELQEGSYIIYDIRAFLNGNPVDFTAYSFDDDNNKRDVKKTSVINIKKNNITYIHIKTNDK